MGIHPLKIFTLRLLAFVALITASPSHAVVNSELCYFDPIDPWDRSLVMPFGPNLGKCVDLSKMRSVSALEENTARAYGANSSEHSVANFSHAGKFWIAHIPENNVEEVIFQIHYFQRFPLLPHIQLRFKLKPNHPIRLVSQTTESREAVSLNDIVFSAEAIGPKDQPFGILPGLQNRLLLAHRLVSHADKVRDVQIMTKNRKVRQFSLLLNEEQKQRLLQIAIETADQGQMSRPYHLAAASCTVEVFHVIDQLLSEGSRKHPLRLLREVLDMYPVPP